jgi:hypothetical protein
MKLGLAVGVSLGVATIFVSASSKERSGQEINHDNKETQDTKETRSNRRFIFQSPPHCCVG